MAAKLAIMGDSDADCQRQGLSPTSILSPSKRRRATLTSFWDPDSRKHGTSGSWRTSG